MLHPTIPAAEYPARWARVQAMLADLDLDYLVAYADDRATFGPAHARWLANFPVHLSRPAFCCHARGLRSCWWVPNPTSTPC